jgi:hypothetical protein
MEFGLRTWMLKTLLIVVFGLAASVILRTTTFFPGVVGGFGYSLGKHLGEFPGLSLPAPSNTASPTHAGSFAVHRLYPQQGEDYRLEAGKRYQIRIVDLQQWIVRVNGGSVAVWYDGFTETQGCQASDFKFQQYNGRYEIVSCSKVASIRFLRL